MTSRRAIRTAEPAFLKDSPARDNSSEEGQHASHASNLSPRPAISDEAVDLPVLERVYADRARFVWLSLQRLGVLPADLDDVCHDVFIVIQSRLLEFERGAKLSPWIFGICAKVAANYRRRAYRRFESVGGTMSADEAQPMAPSVANPERIVENRRALATAEAILQRLDPLKRAVFVMFELEGLPCTQIAEELELPIGTVYSRLHAARQLFAQHARRALSEPRRAR